MRRWRIYSATSAITGAPVDAVTYPTAISRLPLGVPTEVRVGIVDGVHYPDGYNVLITRLANRVRDPQDGSWIWTDPATGEAIEATPGD